MDTKQEVPAGDWHKDWFKICGHGSLAKTFLLRGQVAEGAKPQLQSPFEQKLHQQRVRIWRYAKDNVDAIHDPH